MHADSNTERDAAASDLSGGESRRPFLTYLLAGLIGVVVAIVPLVSGLIVFFDPLRRGSRATWVRLATLEAVPDDGVPRLFPVVAAREDAWNLYPPEPIGSVYLIRQPGQRQPTAFTSTCPHAGCFVGYTPGATRFECPCHTSKFTFEGQRIGGAASVAPRGMDTLEIELRKPTADTEAAAGADPAEETKGADPEVWVKFERFQTGRHEKIAIS